MIIFNLWRCRMKLTSTFELIIPVVHNRNVDNVVVLNNFFKKVAFSNTPQLEGKLILDAITTPLLGLYELRQVARRAIGLHGNEGHLYKLIRNDLEFQIGKVKLWLFKYNIGFVSIHINTTELDSNQVLDLVSELCSVRLKRQIAYIQSLGKNESEKKTLVIKDMITDLLILLENDCLLHIKDETFQKAHCLFYGVGTAEEENERLIFLEMIRNQNTRNRTVDEYDSEKFYNPYTYITWATSDKVLAVFCDTVTAGEKNKSFLTNPGGLIQSVFTNYMLLYLNLIATDLKMKVLIKQFGLFNITAMEQCPYEAKSEISNLLSMPLIGLANEAHINNLFDRYLCDRTLGLIERRKQFEGANISNQIGTVNNQIRELKKDSEYVKKTIDDINERTSKIEHNLTEWMASVSDLVTQRKARLSEYNDIDPVTLESIRSEFINNVASEIANIACKDATSVDYEEAQLKGMFGDSWYLLDEYTRRSLISAKVFASNCRKSSYKTLDYSGIIISATSALENELKLRFFIGYQDYLYKKVGKPSADKWPQSMLFTKRNGQIVKNTVFTMGSLSYIFDCIDADKESLQNYLQMILSSEYKDKGMSVFLTRNPNGKSFIDRCEDVRNNYRNAAAHTEPVSIEKAEACCVDVIGQQAVSNQIGKVQGLLFDLVRITKNYGHGGIQNDNRTNCKKERLF